jgi:hypothetical protein
MSKKIDAASRPALEYKITGGGHIAAFNTGAYELAKSELLRHFSDKSQLVNQDVTIRNNVDLGNHNIDLTITLCDHTTRTPLYTANLYNTTSRALINGKQPELFRKTLMDVMDNIDWQAGEDLNEVLKSGLVQSEQISKSSRRRKATPKAVALESKGKSPKSANKKARSRKSA